MGPQPMAKPVGARQCYSTRAGLGLRGPISSQPRWEAWGSPFPFRYQDKDGTRLQAVVEIM